MAFSNGIFTRTDGVLSGHDLWQQQEAARMTIQAEKQDIHDQDIADALSTCILKDGTQTVTADIPFNGKEITNIKSATARSSAANAGDVQDGTYNYDSVSEGSDDDYEITLPLSFDTLVAGMDVCFLSHATNAGDCTLNINAGGASDILCVNGSEVPPGMIVEDSLVYCVYSGSEWILLNTFPYVYTEPFKLPFLRWSVSVVPTAIAQEEDSFAESDQQNVYVFGHLPHGDSITLPAVNDKSYFIIHVGFTATAIKVFPAVGENINGLAVNQHVALPGYHAGLFIGMENGTWFFIST